MAVFRVFGSFGAVLLRPLGPAGAATPQGRRPRLQGFECLEGLGLGGFGFEGLGFRV